MRLATSSAMTPRCDRSGDDRSRRASRSTAARSSRAICSSPWPAPRPTARASSRRRLRRARSRSPAIIAAADGRRVPFVARRQSAPRAGARRGEILSAPAGDDRRRHRHQRQDLGRRLHAPDLGGARDTPPPASAPSAWCRRSAGLRLADDARSDRAASHARRARGDGVTHLALRGVVARARPASARRRARRRRRLHQSVARPSRLSPDVEDYLAAKLRLFATLVAADGAAVIAADHELGRRSSRRRARAACS